MTDLIWGFAPWLAFLLAARVSSLYGAVAAGFVAGVVVLVRAIGRKRVHMLDAAGVAYFLVLAMVFVAIRPGHLDDWSRYAQAGSHIALTVLVFGSIVVGRPFTESYARESAPETVWRTRRFHDLNRQISAVWGLAFLLGSLSLVIAGTVDVRQVLLRIIIPFGSLYYAYTYTQRQTASVRQQVWSGDSPG
jgi:hypothetical protein